MLRLVQHRPFLLFHYGGTMNLGYHPATDYDGRTMARFPANAASLRQLEMYAKRPNVGSAGYSLLELLVSCIVMMIMLAIALPSVMRAWRSYQLTSAASQVLGMIKATRSDAIRRNTKMQCLMQYTGGIWWVGEDQNGNGTLEPGEFQVALPGGPTLLAAGIAPNPSSTGYPSAQVPSGLIRFDGRGGVDYGGAGTTPTYVLYIGMDGDPSSGFRAITVTPSGGTQMWTATSSSTWKSVY